MRSNGRHMVFYYIMALKATDPGVIFAHQWHRGVKYATEVGECSNGIVVVLYDVGSLLIQWLG